MGVVEAVVTVTAAAVAVVATVEVVAIAAAAAIAPAEQGQVGQEPDYEDLVQSEVVALWCDPRWHLEQVVIPSLEMVASRERTRQTQGLQVL